MKKCVMKYYSLHSDKVAAGQNLRLIFISDLHNTVIGDENIELLCKIRSLSPDVILLGGDLIVGRPGASMEQGLLFASRLTTIAPVIAANGNHEYRLFLYPETYGDMYDRYINYYKKFGILLLENASHTMTIDGMKLQIEGFDLPCFYYNRFYRGTLPHRLLADMLPPWEENTYRILLAHNPKYFSAYASFAPDLILSGHYHGGIVRTPGNRPLIGNDFTVFPKYGYGKFEKAGSTMLVSAGLGEHTIPLRIHNPREVVIADIRR